MLELDLPIAVTSKSEDVIYILRKKSLGKAESRKPKAEK